MEPEDLLKFFKIAGKLKSVKRKGWENRGINDSESVADHSFRVTIIAMVISDHEGLDTMRVLKMALLHDLPESKIGDLTKADAPPEKDVLEKDAIIEILNLLQKSQKDEYLALWKEYRNQKTREASLVRQADKIEMLIQAREYEEQGYDLRDFFENDYEFDKMVRELYRIIQ